MTLSLSIKFKRFLFICEMSDFSIFDENGDNGPIENALLLEFLFEGRVIFYFFKPNAL